MSQQLMEHRRLVLPDYGGFDLYDSEFYEGDPDVLDAARADTVAASNGRQICVVCGQDFLRVELTIQLWDGAPEADQEWDGHREFVLPFPTALLVVSERTAGASDVTLPTGPGIYHVRLGFRHREKAEKLATMLAGASSRNQRREHAGTEQYLLQLWRRD